MTQQHESLSALVDGEVQDDNLVSALANDKALADKWKNYHLIRSTMRNELPPQIDIDLGDKIVAAIEQEPTILAPKKRWQQIPVVAQVVPLFKQGGQFAVAASFAAAMIIGVQQFNTPETEEPFSVAPPFAAVQGGLSPVSLQQTRTVDRPDVLEQRKRISALLTDHNQQVRLKHSHQLDKADEEKSGKPVENTEK